MMRIRESFAMLGAAVSLLATPLPAHGEEDREPRRECDLALRVQSNLYWRGIHGRGYQVFDHENVIEPVALTVRHSGKPCRFAIVAMPQNASNVPVLRGRRTDMQYDVRSTPQGQTVLSLDYFPPPANQITGAFGRGDDSQTFSVYVTVPVGQVVPAGTYTGNAIIRLFEIGDDRPQLSDEELLSVTVPVTPALEVALANAASGARQTSVDLGELTQGSERSVGFTLRSNSDVKITLTSLNRGFLAHDKGAPGIKYRAILDGTPIDLHAPATTRIKWNGGGHFRNVGLDIRVPAVPRGTAAGSYRDTITVNFTAED